MYSEEKNVMFQLLVWFGGGAGGGKGKFWVACSTKIDLFLGLLEPILTHQVPVVAQQCLAATLGGITTTTLVNPLDLIRTRLQV